MSESSKTLDGTKTNTGKREKEDVLPCTGQAKTCVLEPSSKIPNDTRIDTGKREMPGCWMNSKKQDRRNLKTSAAGTLYYWDRQVLGRVQVATQSGGEILYLNHIEVLYLLQKCVRKYSCKYKG
ncbi:uncharacterized protein LOC129838460 isoform X3 [Salvelinus fontinalis]|uniref:uncharacterized protein LOC129838460 isoform X3 n=1 Tax=Salvelinus fontinalis TaxID=8038 RepID=UPI002485B9AF|nr:uncharacterized protein LOC129838460 isoform X3 [Salvelinus fontinalis]